MATDVWPWFALAGAGVLHGLNPLTGWPAAAWAARPDGRAKQWARVLGAMSAGHLVSVLLVAAAVPLALQMGLAFDPLVVQGVAAAVLVLMLTHHLRDRTQHKARPTSGAALGVWSFIVGTGHGAGWMLLPALASICTSDMPGRVITASGSLALGLAAVAVHMGAMLLTTVFMAAGIRWAWRMPPRCHRTAATAGPGGGSRVEGELAYRISQAGEPTLRASAPCARRL